MSAIQIVLSVVLLVLCVIVITAVTVKEPKGNGIGALGGDSNSYFDKNSGRTKESMLARAIGICGAALCVVTLILLFVIK